mmetsp:Transcript_125637/g.391191  ORF Transcript_125637/g.391191 Transcript_125637/m.391191 type:complete len:242 (-) Transcript_125637:191-916(-)
MRAGVDQEARWQGARRGSCRYEHHLHLGRSRVVLPWLLVRGEAQAGTVLKQRLVQRCQLGATQCIPVIGLQHVHLWQGLQQLRHPAADVRALRAQGVPPAEKTALAARLTRGGELRGDRAVDEDEAQGAVPLLLQQLAEGRLEGLVGGRVQRGALRVEQGVQIGVPPRLLPSRRRGLTSNCSRTSLRKGLVERLERLRTLKLALEPAVCSTSPGSFGTPARPLATGGASARTASRRSDRHP